jgi:hypothetical protein
VDKLVATTGLTYWFPKEREGYMYDLLRVLGFLGKNTAMLLYKMHRCIVCAFD